MVKNWILSDIVFKLKIVAFNALVFEDRINEDNIYLH